jgi:hypothetical protein
VADHPSAPMLPAASRAAPVGIQRRTVVQVVVHRSIPPIAKSSPDCADAGSVKKTGSTSQLHQWDQSGLLRAVSRDPASKERAADCCRVFLIVCIVEPAAPPAGVAPAGESYPSRRLVANSLDAVGDK